MLTDEQLREIEKDWEFNGLEACQIEALFAEIDRLRKGEVREECRDWETDGGHKWQG